MLYIYHLYKISDAKIKITVQTIKYHINHICVYIYIHTHIHTYISLLMVRSFAELSCQKL